MWGYYVLAKIPNVHSIMYRQPFYFELLLYLVGYFYPHIQFKRCVLPSSLLSPSILQFISSFGNNGQNLKKEKKSWYGCKSLYNMCKTHSFWLYVTNVHAVVCVIKGLCTLTKSTVAFCHFSWPVKPATESDVFSKL